MPSVASRIYSSTRALRQQRLAPTLAASEDGWRPWMGFLDQLSRGGGTVTASAEAGIAGDGRDVVDRPLIAIVYSPREDLLSLTVTLRSGRGEVRHLFRTPKLLRAKRLRTDLELLVEDGSGTRTRIWLFNVNPHVLEAMPAASPGRVQRETGSRDAGSRS